MKLNSYGQTLVLFVLLLPIFIIIMYFAINLGLNLSAKRTTDEVVKYVVEYGVEHKDDENIKLIMETTLIYNLDNIKEVNIEIGDEIIVEVTITFNNRLKDNITSYTSKYKGYIENGEIKIVRG